MNTSGSTSHIYQCRTTLDESRDNLYYDYSEDAAKYPIPPEKFTAESVNLTRNYLFTEKGRRHNNQKQNVLLMNCRRGFAKEVYF